MADNTTRCDFWIEGAGVQKLRANYMTREIPKKLMGSKRTAFDKEWNDSIEKMLKKIDKQANQNSGGLVVRADKS